MTTPTPDRGTVLQFTPVESGWTAEFTIRTEGRADETWVRPVIGWAVVVRSSHSPDICEDCQPDAFCAAGGGARYDTAIQPVCLDDNGDVVTAHDVREEMYDLGRVTWKARRPDDAMTSRSEDR